MYKNITEDAIRQACARRKSEINDEVEILLKSVETETLSLQKQFNEAINAAGFSSNAFVRFDQMDYSSEPRYLPDGLYTGMLKHPASGSEFLPAILPFASSNATGFCIDDTCDAQVTELLQMFAFRLLLSIPIHLVKCHFIDLHSFGHSAKHFSRLSDKSTSDALISDKKRLSDFISELESIVNRLNRNELLDCDSLRDYNANPAHIGVPYHFVFLSHIHDRIDRDTLSRLYSLCSGKNATTCGIYFFYTIDKDSIPKQNDPLIDLLSISTLITKDYHGYHISNSVYGKDFESKYAFEIGKVLPDNIDEVINEIKRRQNIGKLNFDQEMETLIESEGFWKESTAEGITIPIGEDETKKRVYFTIAGNGDSPHYFAMIGGGPGSGKTVLLHDIICYGSILYSPKELEFYLMDCTNGTSFKPYENLPHARFVSITKQREYTDSAIDYLVNEMYYRAKLFKRATEQSKLSASQEGDAIDKIEVYRKKTGQILPRILVIIDEFQVLLEKRDRLSLKVATSLEKLIREGRKYGISIVFCTQSYRQLGVEFNTDLITFRIAFKLMDTDSIKVLGPGNDSAAHLKKVGDAIINDNGGEKGDNIYFHAYHQKTMQHYVDFCDEKWKEQEGPKPKRFIFDEEVISNLGDNIQYLESQSTEKNPHHIITYVGVPMFIRENHSFVTFRKANDSNLLICGKDVRAALSTIAAINYQLEKSLAGTPHRLFIADYFNESSEETLFLRGFSSYSNILYLKKEETLTTLELLSEKLKERIMDNSAGNYKGNAPIIGTIAFLQNAPEMEKNGYQLSKMATMIQNILKKGPTYGIHLIVYIDNYKRISDTFDSFVISNFGNRIILREGAIEDKQSEEVKALENGRALLFTEDRSTTYERDPVMLYNEFRCDSLKDEVFDFIFSIYKKEL